jgi:hypothetical protein
MTQTLSRNHAWSQIVATAWADEDFKARLLAEPRAVLNEYGLDVPEGVEFVVMEDADAVRNLEDSDTVRYLVLPASPAGDLGEEELVPSADAYSYSGFCGYCGRCGCHCRCH